MALFAVAGKWIGLALLIALFRLQRIFDECSELEQCPICRSIHIIRYELRDGKVKECLRCDHWGYYQ